MMLRVAASTSAPTYDGTDDGTDDGSDADRSSFDQVRGSLKRGGSMGVAHALLFASQASEILNGLDASYIINFKHIRLEKPPIACGG
jgi:hypothetical protein